MKAQQSAGFFAQRWNAAVDVRLLFWRDVLATGTLINLLAGFVALMLLAQGVGAGWALAAHLAPLPYNLFLLASIWRSPQRTPRVMLLTSLWFMLMLVL